MNIDNLYLVRNFLQTDTGDLLINYLSNYITENACKNREASEIKGMCELLHQIKKIPQLVDKKE